MTDSRPLHPHTRLLHAGQPGFNGDGNAPVNAAIVRTSTVRFATVAQMDALKKRRQVGEQVSLYGRHGTDTHRALEAALCTLEGANHAWLAPSGVAAITLGMLSLLGHGDHVLITDSVYDPVPHRIVSTLFARFGIESSYFDPLTQPIEEHLRSNTRVVYAESPGSILFEVLDIPAIARATHAHGALLMVDNTWAAGYLQAPMDLGADLVACALTKYQGGHSDLMQGALLARDDALARRILATYEALGYAVSADDASLVLRGLRTLPVRMAQHGRHVLEVANWLLAQPEVENVYCPGLPSDPGHALWKRDFSGHNGLLSVQFKDFTGQQLNAFADALQLHSIGASWGGYESLALPVTSAALAPHQGWQRAQKQREQAGLPPSAGVVRLHVGLEDVGDLTADLQQAIQHACSVR
ncbi:cystathionine beta-lyase [Ottowia thiooxydans]|uniref:Cystathionine beta-lyase n=1 Tax=Ottowia thiooxydans TaxID=219182 RepID=A0ABV2QC49_9BURK